MEFFSLPFYMTKHDKILCQLRETLQKCVFVLFTIKCSSIDSSTRIRAISNTTFKRFESLPHRALQGARGKSICGHTFGCTSGSVIPPSPPGPFLISDFRFSILKLRRLPRRSPATAGRRRVRLVGARYAQGQTSDFDIRHSDFCCRQLSLPHRFPRIVAPRGRMHNIFA